MYRETVGKINRPPLRGIAAACALLLSGGALSAQETTARMVPGQRPPRALSDWEARNAVLRPSPAGGSEYIVGGASYEADESTDLLLHFEDAKAFGPYAAASVASFERGPGRIGAGAARFKGPGGGVSLAPGRGALLSAGSEPGSFSLEFWIRPANAEDGDAVLSWSAGRWIGKRQEVQSIGAEFDGGRLVFSVKNVFTSRKGAGLSVILRGRTLLVPGSWSHHLLRFDYETGLVEYLMNGRPEAIAHATETGDESSAVCEPAIGGTGLLVLGPSFRGSMDEFRISRAFVEKPALKAFRSEGAEILSPILDLGSSGSRLVSADVKRIVEGTQGAEYFYRLAEDYAGWTDDMPAWTPFEPGAAAPLDATGRYAQVSVRLYPDGSGETSPALRAIDLRYRPDPPPPPPARVILVPGDGEILVSWTRVPEADVAGYRVYYGEGSRSYGSSDSAQGRSPIDAGNATSIRLTGLVNGKLYYVSVAAYELGGGSAPFEEGEFSMEANARPLRKAR